MAWRRDTGGWEKQATTHFINTWVGPLGTPSSEGTWRTARQNGRGCYRVKFVSTALVQRATMNKKVPSSYFGVIQFRIVLVESCRFPELQPRALLELIWRCPELGMGTATCKTKAVLLSVILNCASAIYLWVQNVIQRSMRCCYFFLTMCIFHSMHLSLWCLEAKPSLFGGDCVLVSPPGLPSSLQNILEATFQVRGQLLLFCPGWMPLKAEALSKVICLFWKVSWLVE